MKQIRDWVPCGYTLNSDPAIQDAQFRFEYPKHRGQVRYTPMPDGFIKVEFKGEVLD